MPDQDTNTSAVSVDETEWFIFIENREAVLEA